MTNTTEPVRYCLVGDDSGHDYVIPVANKQHWYDFIETDKSGDVPDYALRVEGGLTFTDPRED